MIMINGQKDLASGFLYESNQNNMETIPRVKEFLTQSDIFSDYNY